MAHQQALTRLRVARLARALSVAELASASGISDDTIRRIESGRGQIRPRMATLRGLADALDVAVTDLLDEDAA